MKRISQAGRRFILLLLPAVILLCSAGNYRISRIPESRPIWKGYRPLMVDAGVPREEVEALLDGRGWEYLSLNRETVEFFDYSGLKQTPLTRLDDSLDPLDPRRDPYMARVGDYYRAENREGSWNLFYLASEDPLPRFRDLVEQTMAGTSFSWELADRNADPVYGPRILFLVFAAALFVAAGRDRWWSLAAMLPWAGALFQNQPALVLAAGTMVLTLFFLRSRGLELWKEHLNYPLIPGRGKKALWLSVAVLGVGFVFSLIWTSGVRNPAGGFLFLGTGILGQSGAACLELFLEHRRFRRREHRLFYPVFLLSPPRPRPSRVRLLMPLLPAGVLALILFLPGEPVRTVIPRVPAPQPLALSSGTSPRGESLSWENLSLLYDFRPEPEYPDLSDYLAHRAYQDSYFYGGTYRFPLPGKMLETPRFFMGENGPEEEMVTLKEFTDDWYTGILDSIPQETIAALLMRQGEPCFIRMSEAVVLTGDTDWKSAGYGFFAAYFTVFFVYTLITGRRKPRVLTREIKPLAYSREMEKENIA